MKFGDAAAPLPNIALPVFDDLTIDGYQLFPGATGNGLNHTFLPGVTVIAGINGIGKTTLLNVMLRLLLGPFNPQKVNPFEVGAKSHELVRWRQARRFFASRVGDGAVSAIAHATVSIGAHTLKLSRALKDLSITYLEFDGMELDPTEDEYERVALEASNAATRYDYDFLVRYLVFFLEHRVPLFWNERGQMETFRILLCDAELANTLQALEDDIRTKDSLYRNLRWHANNNKNRLSDQLANFASSSGQAAKIVALREAVLALRKKDATLIDAITERSNERSELRTRLLLTKIELEEVQRANEGLQQSFLAAVFPGTSESARHIFSTLLSNRGCTVCGNRTERGVQRLEHLLAHGHCPVCESPPGEQERVISQPPPSAEALEQAAANVRRLQKAVSGLERRESELGDQLRELFAEQATAKRSQADHIAQLQLANASLPATPDELRQLELQVQIDADELKSKEAELHRLYADYELLVKAVEQRVSQISETVQTHFSNYAQAFLAEKCYLGQASYRSDLGESRSFTYPCFQVFMTSAVSPDQETQRTEAEDVSESQREFIDLAFRMALIAAATQDGARSMLVIETPEASLDAYFVDQAGTMLKNFANGDSASGNVVIVSSNLATQNMIGALLGFTGPERRWPKASAVQKRVINLLQEGAPNAALRERRSFYENFLHEATHGRLRHNHD
ncbi:TPA: hypothetical protein QDC59_001923 [Burkholderia cenocepacia]|nr:hypothetical protein [Burkholderia cenocepacia]